MIEEPNSSKCKELLSDNQQMFSIANGSKTKHQTWEGGYLGHITDSMNIAIRLYDSLNSCRKLPFTLSDSLLVLFLHDLEKPWKYGGKKEVVDSFDSAKDFIEHKIKEYGFDLNDDHKNAIKYVHGEGDDYHPEEKIQKPLAAFVNACDNISARIFYDFPKRNEW